MKKKLTGAVALMLALLFLMPCVVAAAPGDKTASFSDVVTASWYYESIRRLTGLGAINGYPDGSFHPDASITCAEFAKILMTTLGYAIEMDYDVDAAAADMTLPLYLRRISYHWAFPYVVAAYRSKIIASGEFGGQFAMDSVITRGEMVRMMIRALGVSLSPAENVFTDAADKYAITAYYLYLVRGYMDEDGRSFRADGVTTRAEAATIVVRALDYNDDPRAYVTDAISANASLYYLDTDIELIDFFISRNFSLAKRGVIETNQSYFNWTLLYSLALGMYPEYFLSLGYYTNHATDTDKYVLNFQYGESTDELRRQADEAKEAADAIGARLNNIYIDPKNRLREAHNALLDLCAYDTEGVRAGNIADSSYTAYGAMIEGKAVCQGYSAAMNLLCDAIGIPSYGVTGLAPDSTSLHMWIAVLIDGEIYFCDATFDDPGGRSAQTEKYALMTLDEAEKLGYVWDKNTVKPEYFFLAY